MSHSYVYDAGALIAIDNNDRRMWTIHHLAIDDGRKILVPAPVVGQAWRDPRRQVQLGKNSAELRGRAGRAGDGEAAGVLCGKAGTGDIVDALVVTVALTHGAIVFTSAPEDIAHLSASSDVKPGLSIRRV